MRSLDKEPVVRARISATIDSSDQLSYAAADLSRDAGWDAAVAGCDYVLQLASPILHDVPCNPNVQIVPVRDGALDAAAQPSSLEAGEILGR